ncbi:hypothetical protein [Dactylosporangium salmoneum]|uniref:hypothetical protein n=1 Tax=Dactylosporangium salmoneum TaxID=53361 RepID=UPI0031E3DE02
MTDYPYNPPIDANLSCRNCADPIIATARVSSDGPTISGLREYRWTHAHGSDTCRPKTVAQPFDGWHATRAVERIEQERRVDEDAFLDATEGMFPVGAKVLADLPHPKCLSDCVVLGYDITDGVARYKLSRRVGSPMSGYAYRPLADPVDAALVRPHPA